VMRKCPRCGEPDDGLFNKQMDTHGPFCAFCGWPERLNLTGARQALPLGYRCEAHEGDVADGRCVCCEVAQVADLTAQNAALRKWIAFGAARLHALERRLVPQLHPGEFQNCPMSGCVKARALLAAETAEPHPHDWH